MGVMNSPPFQNATIIVKKLVAVGLRSGLVPGLGQMGLSVAPTTTGRLGTNAVAYTEHLKINFVAEIWPPNQDQMWQKSQWRSRCEQLKLLLGQKLCALMEAAQSATLGMTRMSGQRGLSVTHVVHCRSARTALAIATVTMGGSVAGGQLWRKQKQSARTMMNVRESHSIMVGMSLDLGPWKTQPYMLLLMNCM